MRPPAGVSASVAVLARLQFWRPARVWTGTAMVEDGRNSSENGKTHSQLRCPLGYPKRVDLGLTVDDHNALLGARLRRGSR